MIKKSNEIKLKKDRKISDWEIVVFALIGVLLSFYLGVKIIDWIQPDYTIYKTECSNKSVYQYTIQEQKSGDYKCKSWVVFENYKVEEGWKVVSNVLKDECDCGCPVMEVINQTDVFKEEEICEQKEVDEIFYISEDCRAHSSNEYEAFFNCVFNIDKKNLNDCWLYTYGECIEYNCDGKDCKKGDCHVYKIGNYEVKVE